jgi:broad specificity phosphatase PhoE
MSGANHPRAAPDEIETNTRGADVPVPRLVGLQDGPATITLVRHGESIGNLADAEAHRQHAERLDLDARDADVELSDTGHKQADALRRWLQAADDDDLPTVVLSSPYRRAADTALRAVDGLGLDLMFDERLRERSLGVFDGLTGEGIRKAYPEEAERRRKLGKFYYQPPSGESWADVVLRVRSLLGDLRHGFDGARVWLFSHQAVIMSFRYVLEGLDEQRLLEIDRTSNLGNVSLTTYERRSGDLVLTGFGDTSIVDAADADVTREPSVNEETSDGD